MKTFKLSLVLLSILFFGACEKDDSPSNNPNQNSNQNNEAFAQNFGSEITRSFLGTVIDKNKNPIQGVAISIGSTLATTDANGVFVITDATVNQRFAYIKAEKAGYINGSRAVVPSNGINKVTIMLLEETVAGTTSSGTTETITMTNGASVALEGDYVKEDGSTYSGNVDVIMQFLDPTDEDMTSQMPGMLYAANLQNEERMLQTFGMLAVELRGTNGEDLNLAEGSEAEIIVPLDPSLVANAPATIPLWWFDEDNGYWKEDGQATLVGNSYVGTVTHFSFWNCDIPVEAVNLCVNVTNLNGLELADLIVKLISSDSGEGVGVTNGNGQVCGIIPKNETLEINIRTQDGDNCQTEILYSSVIGPFSESTSIEVPIEIPDSLSFDTVLGNFITCDGNPVENGYVSFNYEGSEFIEPVSNGSFSFDFLRCSDSNLFTIQGFDNINIQQTDSISYTFSSPVTNIGNLTACETIEEFIVYQIDDQPYIGYYDSFPNGGSAQQQNTFVIQHYGPNLLFEVGIMGSSPGSYETSENNAALNIAPSSNGAGVNTNEDANDITFYVSTFGNVGEYVDINFNGTYIKDEITHTINGTIHIIRDL